MKQEEVMGNFRRQALIREIDSETLFHAKEIFDDYKNRGVILNHSFGDHEWKLTNQVQNVGFVLIAFEGTFQKNTMRWVGCNYSCFMDCIKSYIVFNLGQLSLATLQEVARVLSKIVGMTKDEATKCNECLNHIVTFLESIPGESPERDYVIELLEERIERSLWKQKQNKQRQLADFKSYLQFHDVITNFWKQADEKQRLFYFPLYLWWNLTAILPLRPTEFLLIPRDCLRANRGSYDLTIRRTRLKGSFSQIGYSIDSDYDLKTYSISNTIADELLWYQSATSNMPGTTIKTLLLQKPHNDYLGRPAMQSSGYYTYNRMNACLRCFYNEVIETSETNIAPIKLGDTRHIAMTNLIISGGSPIICRELAGHSDIDISSHYYANISNLVECVTLEKWRKAKAHNTNIEGIARYPVLLPKDMHRVAGGYCDALSIKEGKIDECLKSVGDDGQIGDCVFCGHYWPDDQGVRLAFYDEKTGRQQVDSDSRYLMKMIELVRKGIGHTEDIGTALLRLQRSSNHYGKCLFEKYRGTN